MLSGLIKRFEVHLRDWQQFCWEFHETPLKAIYILWNVNNAWRQYFSRPVFFRRQT